VSEVVGVGWASSWLPWLLPRGRGVRLERPEPGKERAGEDDEVDADERRRIVAG
jgi:hypothetical protein